MWEKLIGPVFASVPLECACACGCAGTLQPNVAAAILLWDRLLTSGREHTSFYADFLPTPKQPLAASEEPALSRPHMPSMQQPQAVPAEPSRPAWYYMAEAERQGWAEELIGKVVTKALGKDVADSQPLMMAGLDSLGALQRCIGPETQASRWTFVYLPSVGHTIWHLADVAFTKRSSQIISDVSGRKMLPTPQGRSALRWPFARLGGGGGCVCVLQYHASVAHLVAASLKLRCWPAACQLISTTLWMSIKLPWKYTGKSPSCLDLSSKAQVCGYRRCGSAQGDLRADRAGSASHAAL